MVWQIGLSKNVKQNVLNDSTMETSILTNWEQNIVVKKSS